MRLDNAELNISADVAEHFGFGQPVRPAQNSRNAAHPSAAVALEHQGPDTWDTVGTVLGGLVIGFIGLIGGIVLLYFVSIVVVAVSGGGRGSSTSESAAGAGTPMQVRQPASRSARQEHLGAGLSSAYLPAEYSTGRLAMPIWLHDQMPRGSGVNSNFIALMPEGTDLFLERENINGWRRVVSYDGRYAGYAMVFPTVPFEPQAMQPYYAKLISRIRRIP